MDNIIENNAYKTETTQPAVKNENVSDDAAAKIAAELADFKGGNREKAVSKFVAETLTNFCMQNTRFAIAVKNTTRTLSDCCAEIMEGCGNSIPDLEVYRGAVKSYFPNADVRCVMDIVINGDDPSEEELRRGPKKKVAEARPPREPKKKPETKKPAGKTPAAAAPLPKPKKPEPKQETIQLSLFG